jgi:flagellar protein FlaG
MTTIDTRESSAVLPDPAVVVGKAAPTRDAIVSASPAAAPQQSDGTVSKSDLAKAVSKLNEGPLSSSFSFSTDPTTDISVVKITDKATGDVIRQLPSKEALALASAIDSELHDKVGQLINQKV